MVQEVTNQRDFNEFAQHITQSWEWGEFRKTTPSIKKVLRLGGYQDGKLKKVWQVLFSKVPFLAANTIAYLPRGPLPTVEELAELKKYCLKERALFLKLEPLSGEARLPNTNVGKTILPQHTIYVDLTVSEEKLLLQMHEKTRYNIRLAQKKGVEVKNENTKEGVEKFIKLLEDTEKRQGFYSHTANYYRQLWTILGEVKMVHLLNAYVDGQIAAGVMLFKFKDTLYYPYGGSNYEMRQYMAPQLLHFEAMKLGKKLGCVTYDLWGSYLRSPDERDPWWGFYRLKSGLGGKAFDFPGTMDVPLSPLYGPVIMAENLRWKLLALKRKIF